MTIYDQINHANDLSLISDDQAADIVDAICGDIIIDEDRKVEIQRAISDEADLSALYNKVGCLHSVPQ